ncbi:MAG: RNA polymerase sigma factor [Pirellulaceae bacterium]
MAEEDSDFRRALERVCSGSEEAIWDFIDEYGPHIQRVVRLRLHQNLRAKFDSIDFVQMVWASLFADLQKIKGMRDPDELILYLVAMARNKVIEETRRRMKFARYNVSKEQSLDPEAMAEVPSVSPHDTPSQHLIAKERLQKMMGTSPRDRRILEMRLKGATYVQIAKAMRMHERTIRQIVGDMQLEETPSS